LPLAPYFRPCGWASKFGYPLRSPILLLLTLASLRLRMTKSP
jgi:hypothetical protein